MSEPDELTIIDLREFGFKYAFVAGYHSPDKAVFALPHLHPGIFELHVVAHGHLTYMIDGASHTIQAGQALLVHPDVVHGTLDDPLMKCGRYWLQIRKPREGKSILGLTPETTGALVRKLERHQTRAFSGAEALVPTFAKLLAAAKSGSLDPLNLANLRNLMTRLLLDFLELTASGRAHAESPGTGKAMELMRESSAPVSLEELARAAGMSESSLLRRFREETGLSPVDFATRLRIDKARHLLVDSSRTVTEIAFELGFATTQHFATVFRRYAGLTPSAYRKGMTTTLWVDSPVACTDPSIKPLKGDRG